MQSKKYKLSPEEIIELVPSTGYCLVTDKISVEGMPVGYMYREKPDEKGDSGWRFMSGTEDDAYMDEVENTMLFDVNTVANFDRAIIPYLKGKVGTELERIEGTDQFRPIED